MAKSKPEIARSAAIHRTIPKNYDDVNVAATNGTTDLGKYSGQFIWLKALTADVTIMLKNAVSAAGAGFVVGVNDSAMQEFFVDPSEADVTLNHRAAGACVLRIFYD